MLKLKLKEIADKVNEKNGYYPLEFLTVEKLCFAEAEKGKYSLGIVGNKPFNPSTLERLRQDGFGVNVVEKNNKFNLTINWIN
jgi:hypothetical protein